MITPAFTGQYYQDTSTKKLWKANSTTAGDWTAVGNFNKSGAGDPTGVETPDFTGQTYRDTATGNIWTSTGLTNADWSLTVQDMFFRWTPATTFFPNNSYLNDLNIYDDNTTILECNQSHLLGISLGNFTQLVTVSFPNLTGVDTSDNGGYGLGINDIDTLTNISAPVLQTSKGDWINIARCDGLLSLAFPALVTSLYGLAIRYNSNLSSLTLASYVPTNGVDHDFSQNSLSLASIDGILARFVANAAYISGTIDISGGTNAAPTQGAGSAHDILVARGVTITHN